jgi:hypothetical protein
MMEIMKKVPNHDCSKNCSHLEAEKKEENSFCLTTSAMRGTYTLQTPDKKRELDSDSEFKFDASNM